MSKAAPVPSKARPRDPRRRLARLLAAAPEPVADGVELLRGGLTRTMNVVLIDDPGGPGVVVFDTGEHGVATGPRRRSRAPATEIAEAL
jgi:hypothetical protein